MDTEKETVVPPAAMVSGPVSTSWTVSRLGGFTGDTEGVTITGPVGLAAGQGHGVGGRLSLLHFLPGPVRVTVTGSLSLMLVTTGVVLTEKVSPVTPPLAPVM